MKYYLVFLNQIMYWDFYFSNSTKKKNFKRATYIIAIY